MKRRATKKDLGIVIAIATAVAVLVIAVIPITISLVNSGSYKKYVEKLTDAINSSHVSGIVTVTKDGSSHAAPVSQASSLYRIVLAAGMGKQRRDNGVFIRFCGQDGYVYQYDTDKLTFDSILSALAWR